MIMVPEVEAWLKKPIIAQTQQRIVEVLKASPHYSYASVEELQKSSAPITEGLITFALMHDTEVSDPMMAAIVFAPSFALVEDSSFPLPLEVRNRVTILAEIISMAHTYTDKSLNSFKDEWDKARPMVPGSLIFEERDDFITAIKALAMHYYSMGNLLISHGDPDEIPYQHAMGGYLMHVGGDIFGKDVFHRETRLDHAIKAAEQVLKTHHEQEHAVCESRPGGNKGR